MPNAQPQHPADQLYARLLDVFGTGDNELFAMEWPGRVLDETTYSYDVSDVYSQLTKPQAVAEAEFRLSDGLVDVAQIVAGPNGQRLSEAFTEALNQFVPAYTDMQKAYQADKQTLRTWLLEPVTATITDGGTSSTVTGARVEVYDALNERYLSAVQVWNDSKTSRLEAARAAADPQSALDEYARWLAAEAPAVEAELESKFADLVVKGYYHEVRTAVATLDISSPGEALEQAKAAMRASGMSSLDESETVYPVQLQPVDWFRGLSTDFQPQDLLLDPVVMQQELLQKQAQIAQLQDQYTFLQSGHTGDEQALQAKVDSARTAFDSALTTLTDQFASNLLTVAKMYFGSLDPADAEKEGMDDALKAAGMGGLTPEQWTALKDGFDAANAAQQTLTEAGRDLVTLEAAQSAAASTDNQQEMALLTSQIAQLQAQVSSLQTTLFSDAGQAALRNLNRPDAAAPSVVKYDTAADPNATVTTTNGQAKLTSYTLLPSPMPAPGQFFDVVSQFSVKDNSAKSTLAASASQTSWDVDLFFGSASGSSDSSSSSSTSALSELGADIKIGFRATKVTIDRGGWFNPTPFAASGELQHLEPYVPVSHGPFDPKAPDRGKEFARLRAGALLPAFPTSFVIAKDVTIVMDFSSSTSMTANEAQQSASSSSGGIFCFGVSSSSSSSSSSHSAVSSVIGQSLVIKIPGPQLLGWFLEYVPEDRSGAYTSMPEGYLPEEPKGAPVAAVAGAAGVGELVALGQVIPSQGGSSEPGASLPGKPAAPNPVTSLLHQIGG